MRCIVCFDAPCAIYMEASWCQKHLREFVKNHFVGEVGKFIRKKGEEQ